MKVFLKHWLLLNHLKLKMDKHFNIFSFDIFGFHFTDDKVEIKYRPIEVFSKLPKLALLSFSYWLNMRTS